MLKEIFCFFLGSFFLCIIRAFIKIEIKEMNAFLISRVASIQQLPVNPDVQARIQAFLDDKVVVVPKRVIVVR